LLLSVIPGFFLLIRMKAMTLSSLLEKNDL
jgi:hypothetical protein